MKFKKVLPWWAKIGGKLVLSRLPFRYQVWQVLGLFRHGKMDNTAYAIKVFTSHVEQVGNLSDLQGKVILEVGPGDSIATAIVASAYGARAILVDVGNFAKPELAFYRRLAEQLRSENLNPPDISQCESVDAILHACNAQYLTNGTQSLANVAENSVDIMFSQAVLEHVRKGEFSTFFQHCRRVIKPSGGASHVVDLKDHLGGSLNNLRFSEKLWESDFFSSSGFYTNRIQFEEMVSLVKQTGFEVNVVHVKRWDELPLSRNRMAEPFCDLSENELNVSGFSITCV